MALRIANIIGARPQFVKYAPIHRALASLHADLSVEHLVIHTGQHYDDTMSKVFFDEFDLPEPDLHLNVGSGTHAQQTGLVMTRVESVLQSEKIDVAVVYGDTNTTLGAALAASKLGIPVVHIEAGLRSFHRGMPEEINRVATDRIAALLLAPSAEAVHHLQREGLARIVNGGAMPAMDTAALTRACAEAGDVRKTPAAINVGDLMFDNLLASLERARAASSILTQRQLRAKDYYLVTMHRAENTDNPAALSRMIRFINVSTQPRPVIFPMHPRTRKLYGASKERLAPHVQVIDPVGYFDLLTLLDNSRMLLTDSGGMQKEAYWLKVPCVTLRDETEWVETIRDGWNVLSKDYTTKGLPAHSYAPHYGDGQAAERIVRLISLVFAG